MVRYGGSGSIAPLILTSALDEGEWSASRPGRFTPVIHLIGWVGPRAGPVVKRNTCPCQGSNPGRPARCSVTVVTELFPSNKKKSFFSCFPHFFLRHLVPLGCLFTFFSCHSLLLSSFPPFPILFIIVSVLTHVILHQDRKG